MKKVILFSIVALFSEAIYAGPIDIVPASKSKILTVFHQNFPEAVKAKAMRDGNMYVVSYENQNNSASGRFYYDLQGNLLQSIQYYTENALPPFLRIKIEDQFDGKKIGSVTEVENSTEHYYQVVLSGPKNLSIVDISDSGNILSQKKYERSKS